jgi:hypothetical protein
MRTAKLSTPFRHRTASAYAARSAMSRDETGLNPRQRHRSSENTVGEIIPGDGVLG